MKTMQYCFGLVVAVFFFAFGVYFHSALPNDGRNYREPASIANAGPKSSSKFDPKATQAFRTCLDSKVKNGSADIGKTAVEGRKWSTVSIPCQAAPAKKPYNAIQPYSSGAL